MDNGVKKAKHFSCKRYRDTRSFFLASLFMRAMAEYREIPTDDFISYWAIRTDTFEAFMDAETKTRFGISTSNAAPALGAPVHETRANKCLGFQPDASVNPPYDGIANTLAEYKLVKDTRNVEVGSNTCMIRNDSSGDLQSETSRDDSEVSSDAENAAKEECNNSQIPEDTRIKESIFYDGDFSLFLQRQKLLYRVIEDLQSSVFVSKPSVDFAPKIDLESIQRNYILLDPKLLGPGRVLHPPPRQTRKRAAGDMAAPAKRACPSPTNGQPGEADHTLEGVLNRCSEGSNHNVNDKSIHMQRLVKLLGGDNSPDSYSREIVEGICRVREMCDHIGATYGTDAFFPPSLLYPVDSFEDVYYSSVAPPERQFMLDTTLYSQRNGFMTPKNMSNYMTAPKGKDGSNEADEEDLSRLDIGLVSNAKLKEFVEAISGLNCDEAVMKNSLEQNAKESCDLKSLIQLTKNENETRPTAEVSKFYVEPPSGNEYYTSSGNHIMQIEPVDNTPVTYYNNRVLPNEAMDFYVEATSIDYNTPEIVRLNGVGPMDISSDTFSTLDHRRGTLNQHLEALAHLEKRIREVQKKAEKMQWALNQYAKRGPREGTNDLQEMLNLETLLFVSQTLMETKKRLHLELRKKVQEEMDLVNYVLPTVVSNPLTRILYPCVKMI